MIDPTGDALWFMGDLSDSWVVSIAGELARCTGVVQVHCPGDLPDRPFDADSPPRMIVVHRHRFTAVDAKRLRDYREPSVAGVTPAIFLCVSPCVRYEELERWSALADLVISEATAADVLPRHVARLMHLREGPESQAEMAGFRIEVAGANHDLCRALVEACEGAGYRALPVGELQIGTAPAPAAAPRSAAERMLTVWDVPVLEPDWPQRLEQRSNWSGPVIALIGFADRETVAVARARGAIACLELPYNVDDLTDVIARASRSLAAAKWRIPGRVEQPHQLPPPPRRRKKQAERPAPTLQ